MKISVIMPVYNCSKIVPDTINSVLSQTLTDFEFIIIDDGSIDDTLSVVKSFADERIRVISVKNGGPAVARNIGIENATGEYLYFIDSDDTIEKDMLFNMYNLSKQNDLDICCCGYKMRDISTKKEYIQEFKYKDFIATNLLEFRNELMGLINAHLMYVVWNKIYKTDFVKENNITFPNFKSGEDRMFNIKCFINIKRFAFVNKGYYNYYIRGGKSLASKYLENRYESVLKTHLEMEHSFKFMGMYDKYKTDINFIFIKGV
ncbi:MAG: glycosyltransferase, partial [Oscillospiraceae bacterium]